MTTYYSGDHQFIGTTNLGSSGVRIVEGRYYVTGATIVTTTATLNQLRVVPFRVANAASVDRIGCSVSTAGAAGAAIRLGIYTDNGTEFPGTLLVDAGTVDATTTGAKEITISATLSSGLYWFGLVGQGASSTVRSSNVPLITVGVSSAALAGGVDQNSAYYVDAISGALPNPFSGTTASFTAGAPRIFVRGA